MFAADLSWSDDKVEKVGDRRQRRTSERKNSISSNATTTAASRRKASKKASSATLTNTSSNDTRPSFSGARPSTSTAHARPSISSARPGTSSTITATTEISVRRRPSNLTLLKDPTLQPDFTLSAKFSPTLPSGAPLDLILPAAVEGGRSYSRQTNSRQSNKSFEAHRPWSIANKNHAVSVVEGYEKVKDAVLQMQTREPRSVDGTLSRSASSVSTKVNNHGDGVVKELFELPESVYELGSTSPEPPIRSSLRPAPLRTASGTKNGPTVVPKIPAYLPEIQVLSGTSRDIFGVSEARVLPEDDDHPPPVPPKTPPNASRWKAPVSWDVVLPEELPADPLGESPLAELGPTDDNNVPNGSHFQRFVRRMETAGPKIILDRLREEWTEPDDDITRDELGLEKHLWALTALQMRSLDRFAQPSHCPQEPSISSTPLKRRRKILELDGNLGEVFQLSAIYPESKINYLSSRPQSTVSLPAQTFIQRIPAIGILPLPYASASMHHIRASTLPSLLPASQIPILFAECHRVLKPGGILELRIVDPTPERSSTGPRLRLWLEDRLMLSLEKGFRCARPAKLIPGWVQEAGFKPLPSPEQERYGVAVGRGKVDYAKCLKLPAAADPSMDPVDAQVGMHVGREMWRDVWGSFVEPRVREEKWWWENPEIVRECMGWRTNWDVSTLFAVKGV